MSKKEKQKKTPDDYDWRFRAVTSVAKNWINPFTGSRWKKGDILYTVSEVRYNKGSVSYPVPDVTAMFLNFSYELYIKAVDHFNKIPIKKVRKIKQTTGNDVNIINYFESLFGSITFAYSALEAFANQGIQTVDNNTTFQVKDRYNNETTLSKDDAENNASMHEKIIYILPVIYDVRFTKQMDAWYKFRKLENLRNRITHIKTKDIKSHTRDTADTLWGELFKDDIIKPHKLAYEILIKFIANSKIEPPRWYRMYPDNMIKS